MRCAEEYNDTYNHQGSALGSQNAMYWTLTEKRCLVSSYGNNPFRLELLISQLWRYCKIAH